MTKEELENSFFIHVNVIDKAKMKEFNLDIIDILLLRWFYDWYTGSRMEKDTVNGETYYWLSNNAVVKNFDIGGIGSASGARHRLMRLCGEEGNNVLTPLLKRIKRDSDKYGSMLLFHLNEALYFSIVSRGHVGNVQPPSIEEELSGVSQDKAIEVPAEESPFNLITPETIAFIDKVLSLNPQFSKPRINLTEPSKALMNIQTYRQELLEGSFIERHQNQLPVSLRSVVLPTLTEADLLSRMAGVKLTNKMGIGDYFLSYNHNTKSYNSMFLSYMSKVNKDKAPTPPKAVIVEVKTSGMHPKAIAYMSDKQKEAHAKLGLTDMASLARVADGVYSWYEDYEKATLSWNEYKSPKNLLWALKNFTEPWKEKTGKSVDELYKTLSVFDTSNHTWLLFARFMYQRSNILLHSKLSCAIIQSGDNWAWVDYNSLRKDIG